MAKHRQYVEKRGEVFYFRIRIPDDLLILYKVREFRLSLKTKDKAEAQRRALLQEARVLGEFAAKRAAKALQEPKRTFSAADIEPIAKLWLSELLATDESERAAGLPSGAIKGSEEGLQELEDALKREVATGHTDTAKVALHHLLGELGVAFKPEGEQWDRVCYEVSKATLKAVRAVQQRDKGEPIDTPSPPQVLPPILSGLQTSTSRSLSSTFVEYSHLNSTKPAARVEFDLILREFQEVTEGPCDVTSITKAHVLKYRNEQIAAGKKAGTVKKKLGLLRAILQFALEQDYIPSNPADRVKPPKVEASEEDRRPFDKADLRKIFSGRIYSDPSYTTASRGGVEASRWLPLIALYSGARLGELCQLRLDDVREEEGVHYLDIGVNAEGQHIKTASSKRKLPLHPELIKLGFLNYVAKQRKAKAGQLFPGLKPNKNGKWGQEFSKLINRYFDSVGVDDPSKDFHSFRHTFKDAARRAEIREDVHDALTGHSSGDSVGRGYGLGVPLQVLAKEIAKVKYDLE